MQAHLDDLRTLAVAQSKHADYQLLHPTVAALFGADVPSGRGRQEPERWAVMASQTPMRGRRVWDIGANTGYFTMAALAEGARRVVSQEGQRTHATFIADCAEALGVQERLEVRPAYCEFEPLTSAEPHDITLCLNVLHHLGDDFGRQDLDIGAALRAMRQALSALATHTHTLWLQLGFNWKGDVRHPLFHGGTKAEMMAFVHEACSDDWHTPQIWIYDAQARRFEPPRPATWARMDTLGEFLNRPLIRLNSKRV